MDEGWGTPRKLTFAEGRLEQLRYWQGKTMTERLRAGTALTSRALKTRGIDLDELKTDWTVSRIPRRKG